MLGRGNRVTRPRQGHDLDHVLTDQSAQARTAAARGHVLAGRRPARTGRQGAPRPNSAREEPGWKWGHLSEIVKANGRARWP